MDVRRRERLGHEDPGSVLRGPPITITCECGDKRDLRYGERVALRALRQALGHAPDPGRAVRDDPPAAVALPAGPDRARSARRRAGDLLHAHRQHLQRLRAAAAGDGDLVQLRAAGSPPALPAGDRRPAPLDAAPRVSRAGRLFRRQRSRPGGRQGAVVGHAHARGGQLGVHHAAPRACAGHPRAACSGCLSCTTWRQTSAGQRREQDEQARFGSCPSRSRSPSMPRKPPE